MEKRKQNLIVVNNDEVYDISRFLKNHPGGYNYILSYKGSKIKHKMKDTQHSSSAMYLLEEYRTENKKKDANHEQELENLIDWNKGVLNQVGKLGNRYKEWISEPVDRNLKLFDNFFLESLTSTPWYVVPIFWIPIIIFVCYSGINRLSLYHKVLLSGPSILTAAISYLVGISIWTLFEYSVHRWVFHMEPSGNSKTFIIFHFTMHGLHHKVPFDSKRLVFPPLPASIVATLVYFLYVAIFPLEISELVFAGSVTGYVVYDMIHFYLHYGSPKEKSYLYTMKRYHNQHHFTHSESGFGISSFFWDKVFGTAIHLRKLTVGIKW